MTKHAKAFIESRKISESDAWPCEWCGKPSLVQDLDCHHVRFRSQGGGDEPENLIGLCRPCHEKAHAGKLSESDLKSRVNGILLYVEENA